VLAYQVVLSYCRRKVYKYHIKDISFVP